MKLNESLWVFSGGLTCEWKGVFSCRVRKALSDFKAIEKKFSLQAPASARKSLYTQGLRYFGRSRSPFRDQIVTHPSFDYWLFLWEKHFSQSCDEENWELQFGLFQGFAAQLAISSGDRGRFDLKLDPDAHFHFYGGSAVLKFPKTLALKRARLELGADYVSVRDAEGLHARFPREFFMGSRRAQSGRVELDFSRRIIPSLSVESCGFLITHGVAMHGLARLSEKQEKDFAFVLGTALAHIQERDAALYAEMTDLLRVLTPLANPSIHGSVSSSYVNMRGTICLSHSKDALLQAETLIHEFCHQKMNQLLLVDPILLPGQGGQVFYSPWRPDARRLRGLILGAHAFLNVANYLIKSLRREDYEYRDRISIMCNVARRLFEVEQAVSSACTYGRFTDFGQRFILDIWGKLGELFHAVQWFPPALIREAKTAARKHRRDYALPLTGIHKSKGFDARIEPIPFGQKRVIRRKKPEAEAA